VVQLTGAVISPSESSTVMLSGHSNAVSAVVDGGVSRTGEVVTVLVLLMLVVSKLLKFAEKDKKLHHRCSSSHTRKSSTVHIK
jgi:hypothetical protein